MLIDALIDLLVEGLLGWHGVLLEEDAAARLFNLVVYDGCFVVTDLLLSLGLKARMRSVSLFTKSGEKHSSHQKCLPRIKSISECRICTICRSGQ